MVLDPGRDWRGLGRGIDESRRWNCCAMWPHRHFIRRSAGPKTRQAGAVLLAAMAALGIAAFVFVHELYTLFTFLGRRRYHTSMQNPSTADLNRARPRIPLAPFHPDETRGAKIKTFSSSKRATANS